MNTALRLGLVASLLLHPHFAESKKCLQNLPVHLKLVVCDQSGLNAESLLTAKTHTLHIFERAGVDVTWIELTDRTTGCTFADHGKYFTVVIAPTAPKGWASVDAMGLAPLLYGQYPRAYIFHSLAKIYAKTLEFSDEKKAIGIIIGHCIAHELGHLLIPADAHGTGIMSPKWTHWEWAQALRGNLLFHPDHARLIQDRLGRKRC